MDKSKLAKLALAALVVASTLPSGVQAHEEDESKGEGTLLAAGCGGHGCSSSKRNDLSDNTPSSYNPYNANTNSYQTSGSSNYGTGNWSSSNPSSTSTYGTRSGVSGSDWSSDANRGTSSWNTDASRGTSSNWSSSHPYGTMDSSSNVDSSASRYNTYGTPNTYQVTAISITDDDFKKQLSPDAQRLFDRLDPNAKKIAKELSLNRDKNIVVKEVFLQVQRKDMPNTGTMYGQ